MILLCADLHLTSRPDDAYRFAFLTQLEKLIVKHHVSYVFMLGDITESKDAHSAALVNRITDYMFRLSRLCEIFLLKGNHDYIDPSCPFFGFLSYFDNVKFISKPEALQLTVNSRPTKVLFLPHTRTKEGYQGDFAFEDFDIVCCHQTFDGAKGSNGKQLEGISPLIFSKATTSKIYAGHVHVPQRVGCVEYLGAVHPVDFGDVYSPRFILDSGAAGPVKSLHLQSIRKLVLQVTSPEQIRDMRLNKHDQLKVIVNLARKDFNMWDDHKTAIQRLCNNLGVDLCSLELRENVRQRIPLTDTGVDPGLLVSSKDVFSRYCEVNSVPKELEEHGRKYL